MPLFFKWLQNFYLTFWFYSSSDEILIQLHLWKIFNYSIECKIFRCCNFCWQGISFENKHRIDKKVAVISRRKRKLITIAHQNLIKQTLLINNNLLTDFEIIWLHATAQQHDNCHSYIFTSKRVHLTSLSCTTVLYYKKSLFFSNKELF